MTCALGTGGDMVVNLAEQFAPDDVKARVWRSSMSGEGGRRDLQMLTERTGGSDLAALETTATPDGDAWRLNGFKWFASNANGSALVVLAKPEGAADGVRGIAPFLVLRERRDGSPQRHPHPPPQGQARHPRRGLRRGRAGRRRGVPARAGASEGPSDPGQAGDGRGLARMMEMTNGARLGIAMMGLGVRPPGARRVDLLRPGPRGLRQAAGRAAPHAAQARRAHRRGRGGAGPRVRRATSTPLACASARRSIKLQACRLGITAASDAIEVHGGNGYVENWPVARILRDAQVNPIWEGPDNILCLDVRRGIEREEADVAFLDRLRAAVAEAPEGDPATVELVQRRIDELEATLTRWQTLDRAAGEARLFPLAKFMVDVYAAALLLEQAGWETARARWRPQGARRPPLRPPAPRRSRARSRHRRPGARSSSASRSSGTARSSTTARPGSQARSAQSTYIESSSTARPPGA